MNTEQEIVSSLKFIGKVKKGEKINTHHMYVQPEGIFTNLKRTFWIRDNRNNTLTFIQDTISRSFELLLTYERSEKEIQKLLAEKIVKDLRIASISLQNFQSTYFDDTKFCCDIDTIIEHISAKLSQYPEDNTTDLQNETN
jgi:hypothetical protein